MRNLFVYFSCGLGVGFCLFFFWLVTWVVGKAPGGAAELEERLDEELRLRGYSLRTTQVYAHVANKDVVKLANLP